MDGLDEEGRPREAADSEGSLSRLSDGGEMINMTPEGGGAEVCMFSPCFVTIGKMTDICH